MSSLFREIAFSNIRLMELRLRRIEFSKRNLVRIKPACFRVRKLKRWHNKVRLVQAEEDLALLALKNAYMDLEKML